MILLRTRPRRPTEQPPAEELLNDLLIALRDVIDSEKMLIKFETSEKKRSAKFEKICTLIQRVCTLYHTLEKRSVDLAKPLHELSSHTGLDMQQFLLDCLEFPKITPYARDRNGLRRTLLCHCGKREAIDHEGLGLCNECLDSAFDCVQEKKKNTDFVVYRSYSPAVRCRHADFNTILVTPYKEGQWLAAWCELCLLQEKRRIRDKQTASNSYAATEQIHSISIISSE
jgi:hypothetical protein